MSLIRTRPSTREYRDNWERVFKGRTTVNITAEGLAEILEHEATHEDQGTGYDSDAAAHERQGRKGAEGR